MPLMKSKSNEAFSHNVKAELGAGKPQKQSLAIAYAIKRKARMAAGGAVQAETDQDELPELLEADNDAQEPQETVPMEAISESIKPIDKIMAKFKKQKNQQYED